MNRFYALNKKVHNKYAFKCHRKKSKILMHFIAQISLFFFRYMDTSSIEHNQTRKATAIKRKAFRDPSISRHHGDLMESSPEIPWTITTLWYWRV